MPQLVVEYHSAIDGWQPSYFSYATELEQLSVEISNAQEPACYRCRAYVEPSEWRFVPTVHWPKRYRSFAAPYRWFSSPQDAPSDLTILDCLTMEVVKREKETPMTATPATPLPQNALVDIRICRDKTSGKLLLEVNAKPLHDLLDNMGAKLVPSGTTYTDRPAATNEVVNNDGTLSTSLLLKREYPTQISLTQFFNRPPSVLKLKEMCESGHAAVRTILDHYRPVDIRYTIVRTMG